MQDSFVLDINYEYSKIIVKYVRQRMALSVVQ